MSTELPAPQNAPTPRVKRSFELYLLLTGLAVMAFLGGLRMSQGLRYWQLLAQILPGPLYVIATGGFASAAAAATYVGIVFRKRWAAWLARILAVMLVMWFWLDRLIFTRSKAHQADWFYDLLASLFLIFFTFAVLAAPAQKRYFSEDR